MNRKFVESLPLFEGAQPRMLQLILEMLGYGHLRHLYSVGPLTWFNKDDRKTDFDAGTFAEVWQALSHLPLPISWIGAYGKAALGIVFEGYGELDSQNWLPTARGVDILSLLWPDVAKWPVRNTQYLGLLLSVVRNEVKTPCSDICELEDIAIDRRLITSVYKKLVTTEQRARGFEERFIRRTTELVFHEINKVTVDRKVSLSDLADVICDGAHPQADECPVTQERIAIMKDGGGLTVAKGVIFHDDLFVRFLGEIGVELPTGKLALMPNSVKIKTKGEPIWAVRGQVGLTEKRDAEASTVKWNQQMLRRLQPELQAAIFRELGYERNVTDLISATNMLSESIRRVTKQTDSKDERASAQQFLEYACAAIRTAKGINPESVGGLALAYPGVLHTELGKLIAAALAKGLHEGALYHKGHGVSATTVPDLGLVAYDTYITKNGTVVTTIPLSVPTECNHRYDGDPELFSRTPNQTPASAVPCKARSARKDAAIGINPIPWGKQFDGDFDGDKGTKMVAPRTMRYETMQELGNITPIAAAARNEAKVPELARRNDPVSLQSIMDLAMQVVMTQVGPVDTMMALAWEYYWISHDKRLPSELLKTKEGKEILRLATIGQFETAHEVITVVDLSKKYDPNRPIITLEHVKASMEKFAGCEPGSMPHKTPWSALRKHAPSAIRRREFSNKFLNDLLEYAGRWRGLMKVSLTKEPDSKQGKGERAKLERLLSYLKWLQPQYDKDGIEINEMLTPNPDTLIGRLCMLYRKLDATNLRQVGDTVPVMVGCTRVLKAHTIELDRAFRLGGQIVKMYKDLMIKAVESRLTPDPYDIDPDSDFDEETFSNDDLDAFKKSVIALDSWKHVALVAFCATYYDRRSGQRLVSKDGIINYVDLLTAVVPSRSWAMISEAILNKDWQVPSEPETTEPVEQ